MTSPEVAIVSGRDPKRIRLRVPRTAELVADHIRRQIILGELQEGDGLPHESVLIDDFNVSRPTLREAFRVLESEGLITVRRGAQGGARVQVPSVDVVARYAGLVLQHRGVTLADVLAARVVVETPAARMLASRTDCAAIADRLFERLRSTEPPDSERYRQFNCYLIELTGNETMMLLTAMLEHITLAASVAFLRGARSSESLDRKIHRTRERLAELIRAGDADAAEALWQSDLSEGGRELAEQAGSTVVDLLGRAPAHD